MHLRSLPTMERISVPVRRHPEHYFVVQRSVRLIAIILYQGYNTLKQGLFLIKAVTALLRESHTLNKAVTAVFTSKAAARYKAVIVLRHTTALLRDPYCRCKMPGILIINGVGSFPVILEQKRGLSQMRT